MNREVSAMRRPVVVSLVAVVALALIGIGGVAFAGTSPRATVPTKTVAISASKCAGGKSYCFKPGPLTVKRGTKVVWKNMTIAPHTVTRCTAAMCGVSGGTGKQAGFHSPTINPGKAYAFKFTKPGTYRYFCAVHGYSVMHGTITVR
jgi:plastocyanin